MRAKILNDGALPFKSKLEKGGFARNGFLLSIKSQTSVRKEKTPG